jgi:hypothetical protein
MHGVAVVANASVSRSCQLGEGDGRRLISMLVNDFGHDSQARASARVSCGSVLDALA